MLAAPQTATLGLTEENMARSQPPSLRRAILLVGICGAAIGILTVLGAAVAFAREHDFSLFATYISDFGNAPGWPAAIFNSGMLVVAPVRFAFLVLLLALLAECGVPSAWRYLALLLGIVAVTGSIGIAAIPFSLNLRLHMGSAFMYFLGTVGLQSILAWLELRARWPRLLSFLCIAVVLVYLVFVVLLSLVGKVPSVTRETPVVWEWLAFVTLMLWLLAHSLVLGAWERNPHGREGEA